MLVKLVFSTGLGSSVFVHNLYWALFAFVTITLAKYYYDNQHFFKAKTKYMVYGHAIIMMGDTHSRPP